MAKRKRRRKKPKALVITPTVGEEFKIENSRVRPFKDGGQLKLRVKTPRRKS